MESDEKERVMKHLRVIGERLFSLGSQDRESEQLYRMSLLFRDLSNRNFLLHWSLENGTLSLEPMRNISIEEYGEYVYYHFITVFQEFLCEEEESISRREYRFHWSEQRVCRNTHKLTFPLEDCLVLMRDISQGSIISWSRSLDSSFREERGGGGGGECQMILSNVISIQFTMEIPERVYITLLPSDNDGNENPLELETLKYVTHDGHLGLLGNLVQPGQYFQISLSVDFTIGFSQDAYCRVKNSGGVLCFDLCGCSLEYWSMKESLFPCRYHVQDVDELLNFEKALSGLPLGKVSPGSANRFQCRGLNGEYSSSLERLALLRSIHVQYIQSFPHFFFQGIKLKVLQFKSRTPGNPPFYILFHTDDFSLAKFRIRSRTLEIEFDLIDREYSKPYDYHQKIVKLNNSIK